MKLNVAVALALFLFMGTTARGAVSVSINTSLGVPMVTDSISTFAPTGADMGGMVVTAYFSDSTSESKTWGATGSSSGGALGTGWSLTESLDTFGGEWRLTNFRAASLTRLVIEGAPGNTVFDLKNLGELTPGPGVDTGSIGSERGWTFEVANSAAFPEGYAFNIDVLYANRVQIGLDPPVGDLWTTLDLSFSGTGGGLEMDWVLAFFADTDLTGGPLEAIPEPASLGTFAGLALLAAGCFVRRRLQRRQS